MSVSSPSVRKLDVFYFSKSPIRLYLGNYIIKTTVRNRETKILETHVIAIPNFKLYLEDEKLQFIQIFRDEIAHPWRDLNNIP